MNDGVILSQHTYFTTPGLSDSVTGTAALPQNERGLYHADALEGASLDFQLSSPVTEAFGGTRQFTFLDDYYFRIYIIPSEVDFGAIVSDTERTVSVWNAFFENVVLQSITPDVGDEVTFDGPALPATLLPLQIREWVFTAGIDGPPTLVESYTFTFDNGDVFEVPFTGARSVLWPFLPNWSDVSRVSLDFQTDVLTSRDGTEQRIAVRENARERHEFSIAVNGARLRRYRQLMAYWQDQPFIVADISRKSNLAAALAAGGDNVQVSDVREWMVEDQAVILATGETVGLRVIDNVDSAGLVTFKDTDEIDWPEGTNLYFGMAAYLSGDRNGRRLTNSVSTIPIVFEPIPGLNANRETEFAGTVFNGRPLFDFKPNWGESVQAVDRHDSDVVDYGYGRLQRFSPIPYAARIWSGTYVGRDVEQIKELTDFFIDMKGRQREFYAPTWEDDLPVKAPLVIGTTGLRTEGQDVLTAYEADETSRAVMVVLEDGDMIFRVVDEITAISDASGDDTLIEMTTSWDETIAVEDIRMVSWVHVWRFASDSLTVEYLTSEVAQLRLSMQSLEALDAESESDLEGSGT